MASREDSIAHNPEQNGTAERKNRILNDMARCLLIQSGLPLSFWATILRKYGGSNLYS